MQWKPIPGYEGLYSVSDTGLIKSHKGGKLMRSRGTGYRQVSLSRNGSYKVFYIHRLVMLAFRGDSDLTVNHIDGNKHNNKLLNLEYITEKENIQHASGFGKSKYVGVSKQGNKWRAISDGKHIGLFDTPEEAAKAYNAVNVGKKYVNNF